MKSSRVGNNKSSSGEKLRRSKGCAVCLKRRVKCDEKRPSCTQCVKGNRKCHGLLTSIFLHTNPATLAGADGGTPYEPPISPVDHLRESGFTLTWAKPVTGHAGGESDSEIIAQAFSPGREAFSPGRDSSEEAVDEATDEATDGVTNSVEEPSPDHFSTDIEETDGTSATQQHLSNFVHLYNSVVPRNVLSDTWIDQLPNMLSPERDPLVRMCITAVSLVYCGLFANCKASAEAYRWYGEALKRQRTIISKFDSRSRKPTIDEICAPIILSFFEIACGNSHSAQFNHLQGAAELLARHNPSECREGVLFSLYQTLRILMICPTAILRNEIVFGTEDWLSIPLLRYPRSPIGSITDIASLSSSLLSHINSLNGNSNSNSAEVLRANSLKIKAKGMELETHLNHTWIELRSQTSAPVADCSDDVGGYPLNSLRFASPESNMSSSTSGSIASDDLSDAASLYSIPYLPAFQLDDGEGSFVNVGHLRCLAFYSAARLLVLSILHTVNAAPDSYEDQVRAHCERILNAAKTIGELHVQYAYLKLVLPLRVIAVLGTEEQKEKAEKIFPKCVLGQGGLGVFRGTAEHMSSR